LRDVQNVGPSEGPCPKDFIQTNTGEQMQMNVSKEADAEFVRLLENEDPKRYDNLSTNLRRDNPDTYMSEHQALTNWMLGLPTGQWRFAVIAGELAPISSVRAKADKLRYEGMVGEYVEALLAVANAPDIIYAPVTLRTCLSTQNQSAERRKFTRTRIKKAKAGRKSASIRKNVLAAH
jgi:hypothetical protein